MTEKVLITGISGFAGSHLVDYILERDLDVEIYGTIRVRSNLENLEKTKHQINLAECNILDAHNVDSVIDSIRPDKIYHLAAQSFVPTSWKSPGDTLKTNIIGQNNLFEAVRKHSSHSKILIAGSSEEYGLVLPSETPIIESNPLRPLSPYAVSKVAQDYQAYQYVQSYGLHIVRSRAFNHSGPRRPDIFVDSSFAKQVAEIELGLRDPIVKHGNLSAIRDFTHVKDMVHAYWLALEHCTSGEVYNICRGTGNIIQDVLDRLISFSSKEIKTEIDPSRLRPSDVPFLVGDCTKFKQTTGWEPRLNFHDILEDTYNYWIEKLT